MNEFLFLYILCGLALLVFLFWCCCGYEKTAVVHNAIDLREFEKELERLKRLKGAEP